MHSHHLSVLILAQEATRNGISRSKASTLLLKKRRALRSLPTGLGVNEDPPQAGGLRRWSGFAKDEA